MPRSRCVAVSRPRHPSRPKVSTDAISKRSQTLNQKSAESQSAHPTNEIISVGILPDAPRPPKRQSATPRTLFVVATAPQASQAGRAVSAGASEHERETSRPAAHEQKCDLPSNGKRVSPANAMRQERVAARKRNEWSAQPTLRCCYLARANSRGCSVAEKSNRGCRRSLRGSTPHQFFRRTRSLSTANR